MSECENEGGDLVRSRTSFLLLWGVPIAAMVISGFFFLSLRPIVWPVSLSVMGVACLANALRCGRLHCYITGPFFLLLVVASLMHGLAIVDLGESGWSWLGGVTAIGGIGLTYVPEWLFGTYRSRANDASSTR